MYLNSHTVFSLRYGTLTVQELVAEALAKEVEVLALTDINNTSGCMDFVRNCRKNGIKPVLGIEFRQEKRLQFVALARNKAGFQELNQFLTRIKHAHEEPPANAPRFESAYVIYPFGRKGPEDLMPHEFVGIRPEEINRLYTSRLKHAQEKLVVLCPVTYRNKTGWNLSRLLCAVDRNTLLSKLGPQDIAGTDEFMRMPGELEELYAVYPKILENTRRLLENCDFDMDLDSVKNRNTFTGAKADDRLLLRKLARDGLLSRYGKNDQEAIRRVNHELEVIDRLDFSAYFLITWDIVRYAQSRGFFHVGRGSGANSIVAYCMGITDVDPIELDLYFERFLNPHRSSPPDFDIDFSWKDRDEVIDYVFKRYGRKHTSLIATYNTFKGRSIIRELGKVFGLPKPEIDALVGNRRARETPDHISKLIYAYGALMEGKPNYLGIHPGGILISEQEMTAYSASEMPPKGFPTAQFDMFVAEDIGLYKYDILSQRGLGHIRDTVDIVKRNRGEAVDIRNVRAFKDDEKVLNELRGGRTAGCFYIESPAMRQLLTKLECDNYVGLVAASSIIRPGVAKSGMMREYIQRHRNPDGFEHIHPKMGELMEETYGVMVFQEDVIKVAHHFGGIDLADADILRRAMSGKYRGTTKLDELKVQFFANCDAKGYLESISREVWRQIESFSGYSFSKAHSASYAVESFQSLYLKAYYPLEFLVAVINNFGGFYSTEFYLREAEMAGGTVQEPCVNTSEYLTHLAGTEIWLGLVHLKGLEKNMSHKIVESREGQGAYLDIEDFARRTGAGLEQIVLLIRVGALRFTGKSKKALLWYAHLHFSGANVRAEQETVLFAPSYTDYELPELADDPIEDAYDQLELIGYTMQSPFQMLAEEQPKYIHPSELIGNIGRRVRLTGYLVTIKTVKTVKGTYMAFAAFRDREGHLFDTTHFPPAYEKYPFRGKGVYDLMGKVADDFGFPTVEIEWMKRLGVQGDPRGD